MDLSSTIVPKSDQLNSEDLLTGPVTVTVEEVRKGTAEQPVVIHLVEFPGRPFKPSKTVRRLLVAAWGKDASVYTGRRMTLFRDPTVKWAGEAVGGIRVSHLSHIDKPLSVALTVTRGQRKVHVVEPLREKPRAAQQLAVPVDGPTPADIAACTDIDTLREWWQTYPALRDQIEARRAELTAAAVTGDDELPLDPA